MKSLKTLSLIGAFATTVPIANWLIGNIGTTCIPNGPCLIPVGFGLSAPSGVLMIGAALALRDAVHEAGGLRAALAAIAIGSALSWFVAPPALVIASVAAFALAELADLAVYSPLRRRNMPVAVVASGMVGAVIDSAVFLWLAFGSLAFIEGNVLGKVWFSLAYAGALLAFGRPSFNPELQVGHLRDIGNELTAELSRLSALVAGWRPMDSAPKDGTRFLALQGDRHFDCWWKDAGYGEAYWQDDSDSEPDPTHWRPLPASPVSQLKDTTNADK